MLPTGIASQAWKRNGIPADLRDFLLFAERAFVT